MSSESMPKIFMFENKREMLNGELVQEKLAKVDTPLSDFTGIRLSDKSYGLDAAEAIQPALQQMSQLQFADLSDIIAGRPEDVAKQVMAAIVEPLVDKASLTSLDLSANAMGYKGVKAVERVLQGRRDTLQHLYFNNDGLEANAVDHINACLLPTPESTTQLRTFEICRNCLAFEGARPVAELVKRSPHLQQLRVAGTRFPSKGSQLLVESMLSDSNLALRHLDVSDNSFEQPPAFDALVKLLRGPQTANLKVLNLQACSLYTVGMKRVCRALIRSPAPIEVLDLSLNDATTHAAPLIAALIQSKKQTLTSVSLDDNALRLQGAELIFSALTSVPNLSSLSLCNTQLKADVLPSLAAFLRTNGKQLSKLSLNGNFFAEETIDEIRDLVQEVGLNVNVLSSFDDNDADMAEEEYEEEDEEEDDEDEQQEEEEESKQQVSNDDAVAALAASVESSLKM